jgi:2-isopropylmalate synthase
MLGPDGVTRFVACTGTGPVDAVYKAIDKLVGIKVQLDTYGMQAVNEGIDALAITRVTISPVEGDGIEGTISRASLHATGNMKLRKFSGSGSDGDIVIASARAYTSAVNKLLAWNLRRNQMDDEKGGGGAGGGAAAEKVGMDSETAVVAK